MLLFVASLTSTSPLMEKALARWALAELSGQVRLGLFCSGLSARYGKFLSCNWSTIVYLLVLGTSPLPVTPDYAGSTVRYADGVFDPHFGRYVTVMEGESVSSSCFMQHVNSAPSTLLLLSFIYKRNNPIWLQIIAIKAQVPSQQLLL